MDNVISKIKKIMMYLVKYVSLFSCGFIVIQITTSTNYHNITQDDIILWIVLLFLNTQIILTMDKLIKSENDDIL